MALDSLTFLVEQSFIASLGGKNRTFFLNSASSITRTLSRHSSAMPGAGPNLNSRQGSAMNGRISSARPTSGGGFHEEKEPHFKYYPWRFFQGGLVVQLD